MMDSKNPVVDSSKAAVSMGFITIVIVLVIILFSELYK
jgi:hypothetical protein